jgi:hypothetical protein
MRELGIRAYTSNRCIHFLFQIFFWLQVWMYFPFLTLFQKKFIKLHFSAWWHREVLEIIPLYSGLLVSQGTLSGRF